MDQQRAPLFERLRGHAERKPASFHVPGHKYGQGADEEAQAWLGAAMALDATELPGLDDLHHPEGVILEAERLAAALFGAEQTFFLVGGSTVGNMAAILALCGEGDLLLVQRDAHKSVMNGLTLAGARAVFLEPEICPDTGLPGGVAADRIERALARYPDAGGVVLTSPSYFGTGYRLREAVAAAHRAGVPVVVDEAHGAHFGLHPELPSNALSCGADCVIQSTHKMLTSLTMTAMLHVQGERIPAGRVARGLSMLQSSSPSYPLLASLDLARRQFAVRGRALIEEGLRAVRIFREGLSELPGFEAPAPSGRTGWTADPFKVLLRSRGLNGFALLQRLAELGCYAEMALPDAVLLAFSPASSLHDSEALLQALRRIAGERAGGGAVSAASPEQAAAFPAPAPGDSAAVGHAAEGRTMQAPPAPAAAAEIPAPVGFSRRAAERLAASPRRLVPLAEAAGRIAAEAAVPYPPGVPVVLAGERITAGQIRRLSELAAAGARFQGMTDPAGRWIAILTREAEISHDSEQRDNPQG